MNSPGEPTVIKTNILIRSMGPVSELDMDYSMDCYFRQYWRDSRLSFLGPIKSLSLSIKMLERIWRPDTYFYNGKQSYVHTITVPNKLLRITQEGDILYSMRLTIKAKCPMELHSFPMDRQSCPLILGSYAYPSRQLVYEWQSGNSVSFQSGMALSQFDLMGSPQRNLTLKRREGEFSLLQVNFNLRRHTGYFLIQVYVPCILIVVLSWVSFWIHREATSDRVGLCITTVLTLSTISLDSRTDLPKVRYATALDWFLLMSFFYCIATLLEFAGVHYFTKQVRFLRIDSLVLIINRFQKIVSPKYRFLRIDYLVLIQNRLNNRSSQVSIIRIDSLIFVINRLKNRSSQTSIFENRLFSLNSQLIQKIFPLSKSDF
ncbi:unnamed protein product [Nesidiocoris tenuis]|uniref:Neurotransmitter-gated ion-channel ligand-binding domain-containing protein n=1 Tax=Nesidiocoris tenuis TaxID=355587 RepID=A0A6H5FVK7_9HEMI|nr:unnamed protein product [Nesidiocoris tenuis]